MYELIRCGECDFLMYEDRFPGVENAAGYQLCQFCLDDGVGADLVGWDGS